MPAWIHNSTLMEVTEITMSTDQGVRLLSNIIIPQKDSIQIGTQCTPNATCTAVVWVQCWPPRHHIMIIVSILIGVIWINPFNRHIRSEQVCYMAQNWFFIFSIHIKATFNIINMHTIFFYIARLNKCTIVGKENW